jgi:hypothetical protein
MIRRKSKNDRQTKRGTPHHEKNKKSLGKKNQKGSPKDHEKDHKKKITSMRDSRSISGGDERGVGRAQ